MFLFPQILKEKGATLTVAPPHIIREAGLS